MLELYYFQRMIKYGISAIAMIFLFGRCQQPRSSTMETVVSPATIQKLSLRNANGMNLSVINLGGKITELWVPDRSGMLGDVVLGYDSTEQYLSGNPYFGATIGRFGNRIARGQFQLDGKTYQLPVNNGANSLHGGPGGFHHVFWEMQLDSVLNRITLSRMSAAGEAGYPGNLSVEVSYQLTDNNELVIDYRATTDAPTVLNLTHHSFFNLAGAGQSDILQHELQILADRFLPVDTSLIPTGILQNVAGTAFDFRQPMAIGARIQQDDQQLEHGRGYDHNWVLNQAQPGELTLAARVMEPTSGRVMEVLTTEPGLQFYSGNFLDGSDVGKGQKAYPYRSAFCLEAQHFPDSPNQPHFPSVVLRPGEVYTQKTVYRFSVTKKPTTIGSN
jgi:aldose 1-epimerase